MSASPPLSAWPALAGLPCAPLSGGLINDTFAVGEPRVAVVQRLHPVFDPILHRDIDAITAHLAARGMMTPRLLPTGEGGLWTLHEGRPWRALSWVPGRTWMRLTEPALAAAAGRLVARWHRALDGFEHRFHFSRPGAHDTPAHMERLLGALEGHRDHRLFDRVAPLAEDLLARWRSWDGDLAEPTRICHGDLKIANLRFDEAGQGLCLLDLDTMGQLPLSVELGDAWRSWCNPAGEVSEGVEFDLSLFAASAQGYLSVYPLAPAQRERLGPGIERICLELASRFATDALEERYFGWDPEKAPTRGGHNLMRAAGQLALARSVRDQRAAIDRVLRSAG